MRFTHVIFKLSLAATTILFNFGLTFAQSGLCRADFSHEEIPGALNSVQFTELSNQLLFASQWDFGDGSTSNDPNPVHTYQSPGLYLVCLTILTQDFCIADFCDSVLVGNPAGGCIDGSLLDPNAVCPAVLDPVCGCDGVTYDNACTAESYHGVSSYTRGPCPMPPACSAFFEYVPEANGLPNAIVFENASTASPNSFPEWDFGDGHTATDPRVIHQYANAGTYLVCLTITEPNGCTDTYCDSVVVGTGVPTCEAFFDYTYGFVAPEVFLWDRSVGNATSWFWDFGDGRTSTDQNPVHIFPYDSVFDVCLTITTNDGCTSTYCDEVWGIAGPCHDPNAVNPTVACPAIYDPVCGCDDVTYDNECIALHHFGITRWTNGPCQLVQCDAAFSYRFDANSPLHTVNFTNESILSASSGSVFWSFGDGTSSTQYDPSHVYAQSGTYEVCLGIEDSLGCRDEFCDTLTLGNNLCVDPSIIDSTAPCFFIYDPVCGCDGVTYENRCVAENYGGVTSWTTGPCDTTLHCEAFFSHTFGIIGPEVFFFDFSSGQVLIHMWDFGDGNTVTGDPNPVHNYNQGGAFEVCLTIITDDGCTSTYCDSVFVGNPTCIDRDLIDTTIACPEIYDPVCGCDGETYENECVALNSYGVTHFSPGPCNTPCGCQSAFNLQINGNQVEFQQTATGNPTQFEWSFGDGTSSTNPNPDHVYNQPGEYIVCLTVSIPNSSCLNTHCQVVEITGCVDQSLITNDPCPMLYDPVCGCDGITYDNVCIAQNQGGVTRYTQGPCTNSCEALFGWNQATNGNPLSIEFEDRSASGNVFLYQWDFGDGNISTDPNPIHTFDQAGVYTVCLLIFDVNGCVSDNCDTVIVSADCQDPSVIDSSLMCPNVIPVCGCDGVTYMNECVAYYQAGITSWTNGPCGSCDAAFDYEIDSATGLVIFEARGQVPAIPLRYEWDFGDGTTSNDPNPLHIFDSPGIYEVCLTVSDPLNNCQNTYCEEISIGGTNSPCIDSSLIEPNVPCPLVIDPVCGCDGVTYGNACEAETYFGVTSWTRGACNTAPDCQANFEYNVHATGSGYTVELIDRSIGNPNFWIWSSDHGFQTGGPVVSMTFATAGTYSICLVIEADSCRSDTCMLVEVGTQPCEADFSYTYIPTFPEPTIQFHDESIGNVTSWFWDFGDGFTSTDQNPSHVFLNIPDTICLTITTIDGCVSTYCLPVNLFNNCRALYSYTVTNDTVHFVNVSSGGSHFLWDFGNGSYDDLNMNPSVVFDSTGPFVVCITIEDNNTCRDTYCDTIEIQSSGVPGGGNGVSNGFDINGFNISPNPTGGRIRVHLNLPEDAMIHLQMVDLFGRKITDFGRGEWPKGEHEFEFDGNQIPEGVYLMQLETNGKLQHRKVSVKR